jgi:hypothetical protein
VRSFRRAICSTLSSTASASVFSSTGKPVWCRDTGNIVALRAQPGQGDLRRCGDDLGSNGLDLVDDAEVRLEVALG